MEHLLTDHTFAREIAELPDDQINRLRAMLHQAVVLRIAPQEVYDAITRGFEGALGASVSSPPLAYDSKEAAKTEEVLLALVRELEPIREVLESDESDVIPCWALDSRRSAPCGHPNIVVLETATACVIRAI
jgi:hypothetical protein